MKRNQTIAKTGCRNSAGAPADLYVHSHQDCGAADYASLIDPAAPVGFSAL